MQVEVNANNPLGTKGDLLTAAVNLFKNYWRAPGRSYSPVPFKRIVDKHLTMFEGYGQHDSQEFLSHLLDTLHEDTNRILNKPYTEAKEESVGMDGEATARQFWVTFLKRNYSWFVFNFYGQLKSVLRCACGRGSLSFDPFQVISLPIPALNREKFIFYFIPEDHIGLPIKFFFVSKSIYNFNDIDISSVIEKYAQKLKVDPKTLVFATLGSQHVDDVLSVHEPLSKLFFASELSYKLETYLIQLNAQDLLALSRPDPICFIASSTYDLYERVDELKKENINRYWSMYTKFKEHPVITKIFYLNADSTVKDLYVAILRKLMPAIDFDKYEHLSEFSKTQLDDAEKIFDKLISLKKPVFFYIRYNGILLDSEEADKSLRDFNFPEKVKLTYFIRTGEDLREDSFHPEIFVKSEQDYTTDLEFEGKDLVSASRSIDFFQLMERFSTPEALDEHNRWFCPSCQMKVPAVKTLQIYKLPRILIIMFKRNKNAASQPLITFPTSILDMQKFVGNP